MILFQYNKLISIFTAAAIALSISMSSHASTEISGLIPSPSGTELYGRSEAYTGDYSLVVIDAATGYITNRIKLPEEASQKNLAHSSSNPYSMTLSSDGSTIFISESSRIIKIDLISKHISAVMPTGKYSALGNTGISSDDLKVISADRAAYGDMNETYIYIFDIQNNVLSDAIPKEVPPGDGRRIGFANLVVDKVTNKAYLIDNHTKSIAIFDLNTKLLQLNAIPLHAITRSMALDAARGLLYVIDESRKALDVIDVNARKIIGKIKIGKLEYPAVKLSPDGNRAYIQSDTYVGSPSVIVVDTKSRQIIKTFELPYGSGEMRLSSDGKQIYTITLRRIFGDEWSVVHFLDAETGKEIRSIDLKG